MQKVVFTLFLMVLFWSKSDGQGITAGKISGSLQTNLNFFMKDESINAANTPQYETQLYGADSWLNVNYNVKGFDAGIRLIQMEVLTRRSVSETGMSPSR